MKVYLFGKLADDAGKKKLILEPQEQTNDLLRLLEEQVPALEEHDYLLAVNEEVVTDNRKLNPDDEIAVLPPYAGG